MIKFFDILNESSEMINCEHCDWKWKKSEGGNDLYVCHKCGENNKEFYFPSDDDDEDSLAH